jgi:Cu/Ag efflux protein CusF
MKKLPILVAAVMLVASIASAQGSTTKPRNATKGKTHSVTAEVVSTDATASTITLKVGDQSMTMPVQGRALTALASFKAGDKVTASCKDNKRGEHKAITNLKAAKRKK